MEEIAEDQLADNVIFKDLKKAEQLVKEIPGCAGDVSKTVEDLVRTLNDGEFQTEKGISLLDVKCHTLLEYLVNLTHVIMKKVSGEKIENDPAIERLVESRVVLEKIKPIEQRLGYQIQKLITAANTGTIRADDPLNFKPNPDNLVCDDDEEESDEDDDDDDKTGKNKAKKSNIYVPPKIAPAYYDGDETKQSRQQKLLETAKKRALSSDVLQELRKEYDTGPEEIKEYTDIRRQKIDKEMKERARYEEEYFKRLPLTKKQRHDINAVNTVSSISNLARFADISALDLDEMPQESKRRSSKKFKVKKGKFKRKSFKRRKTR